MKVLGSGDNKITKVCFKPSKIWKPHSLVKVCHHPHLHYHHENYPFLFARTGAIRWSLYVWTQLTLSVTCRVDIFGSTLKMKGWKLRRVKRFDKICTADKFASHVSEIPTKIILQLSLHDFYNKCQYPMGYSPGV